RSIQSVESSELWFADNGDRQSISRDHRRGSEPGTPDSACNEVAFLKEHSTVRLIVHPAQIDAVVQHADRHDGEGEHRCARFEMPPECLIGVSKRDMCMQLAVDNVAI